MTCNGQRVGPAEQFDLKVLPLSFNSTPQDLPYGTALTTAPQFPLPGITFCSCPVLTSAPLYDQTATISTVGGTVTPYAGDDRPFCLSPAIVPNLWMNICSATDFDTVWTYLATSFPTDVNGPLSATRNWLAAQVGPRIYRTEEKTRSARFGIGGAKLAYPWYDVKISNVYNDLWQLASDETFLKESLIREEFRRDEATDISEVSGRSYRWFSVNLYGGMQPTNPLDGYEITHYRYTSQADTRYGFTQIGYNPYLYPGYVILLIVGSPSDPPGRTLIDSWGNVIAYPTDPPNNYAQLFPIRVAFSAIPTLIRPDPANPRNFIPTDEYKDAYGFINVNNSQIFNTLNVIYQAYLSRRGTFTTDCVGAEFGVPARLTQAGTPSNRTYTAVEARYAVCSWRPTFAPSTFIGLTLDELKTYVVGPKTVSGSLFVYVTSETPPFTLARTVFLSRDQSTPFVSAEVYVASVSPIQVKERCVEYPINICLGSRNRAGESCILSRNGTVCTEVRATCSQYPLDVCVGVKNQAGVACELKQVGSSQVCAEVVEVKERCAEYPINVCVGSRNRAGTVCELKQVGSTQVCTEASEVKDRCVEYPVSECTGRKNSDTIPCEVKQVGSSSICIEQPLSCSQYPLAVCTKYISRTGRCELKQIEGKQVCVESVTPPETKEHCSEYALNVCTASRNRAGEQCTLGVNGTVCTELRTTCTQYPLDVCLGTRNQAGAICNIRIINGVRTCIEATPEVKTTCAEYPIDVCVGSKNRAGTVCEIKVVNGVRTCAEVGPTPSPTPSFLGLAWYIWVIIGVVVLVIIIGISVGVSHRHKRAKASKSNSTT